MTPSPSTVPLLVAVLGVLTVTLACGLDYRSGVVGDHLAVLWALVDVPAVLALALVPRPWLPTAQRATAIAGATVFALVVCGSALAPLTCGGPSQGRGGTSQGRGGPCVTLRVVAWVAIAGAGILSSTPWWPGLLHGLQPIMSLIVATEVS